MNYTLYGARRSGSFSVEAALAEAGQPVDLVNLDSRSGQQRGDDYLALNPAGKVPALRLPDGALLTESAAILLTLADRHPGLLPAPAHPDRPAAPRGQILGAVLADPWSSPSGSAASAPDPAGLQSQPVDIRL